MSIRQFSHHMTKFFKDDIMLLVYVPFSLEEHGADNEDESLHEIHGVAVDMASTFLLDFFFFRIKLGIELNVVSLVALDLVILFKAAGALKRDLDRFSLDWSSVLVMGKMGGVVETSVFLELKQSTSASMNPSIIANSL